MCTVGLSYLQQKEISMFSGSSLSSYNGFFQILMAASKK